MQISSRFTIAVHMLIAMDVFQNDRKVTSDFLSQSIHVNPVVIRRLLSKMKKAGLIDVQRGSGGATIAKPLDSITLYDVYETVESIDENGLFHFHEDPSRQCPVGRNIHFVLDPKLDAAQTALETELKKTTLQDVVADTKQRIAKESSQS
ncbi:Rrf2 family transcriptional regulator [uncultured Dubosiella sp.]|uniref:Rrf2 family transcriptional regulator n=2 Tax=uncultured Dubosiella sp. TaxID=1937011 RepID=UPI0025917A2B|nr:Rrf2 family transcriptional regulator [uncultured Dubosiella sp.]